ncbi:DNA-dependent metalloprotease SPRTN-like [Xenopus laevis]|uniref:DNA-dependent metalloprotease SPRTN-like n=1 Tax=Xenopus laevis TaxID=8355 RepID=A0A8J1M935_XENLA|nr:DNA-dependent metalloprotease SPRTN-like [Xenopus laevis]
MLKLHILSSRAAGLCWPDGNGNYIVRLNKPLLEQRPRRNTAEILLHEMIHVYQFVTCARDLDHGASFQYHCRRIKKLTGVKITTYHQFHKEYDELKRHWWICQGPCGELVRRTMNRPPCTKAHKRKCGGDFVKIQEPNESPAKKKRKI